MASAVTAAAPFPVLQPEMKAVVSKICQSALVHALRALEPLQVTGYICKAGLCLIFTVLSTAPREVRTILSQLEAGIRERFLFHRNASVRNIAVLLSAHLLVCHAQKTRIKVFEERLNEACEQLHDIMNMIDMFGPHDGERRKYAVDEALGKLSLPELQLRVITVCTYIRHVVELQQNMLMPMPLATLYRALLRGIEERCVDAYATHGGTNLLDTDSVFLLINTVMVECAETLVSVTEACGKDATIVFTHHIGQCLETKLSYVVLRSQTEAGVSSNLCERGLMYRMVGGMIEVLGCGLIEYVSGMLEKLFAVEVKLHIACTERHALLGNGKSDVMEGNNHSRKRKRYQNEEGSQKAVSKSTGLLAKATPMNSLDKYSETNACYSKQTLQEALRCVIGVFEHRGYISEQVSEHLRKIEHGIMKLVQDGEMFEDVVHATSAAGLSGGCNRMYGEASELLFVGSKVCGRSLIGSRDARLLREAKRSRSAFESLFHARSPAFCEGNRLCDEPIEGKVVVRSRGTELAEKIDVEDNGRENEEEIVGDVRNTGGDTIINGTSQYAGKVSEGAGVIGSGRESNKECGDVGMAAADGGTLGVMDGRAKTGTKDAGNDQSGPLEREADSRDKETNADGGHNHEGEPARERVTTTGVTCARTEGHSLENKTIDLRDEYSDGEAGDARARDGVPDGAEARVAEAKGAPIGEGAMVSGGPELAQQHSAAGGDASPDAASRAAAGGHARAHGTTATAQNSAAAEVADDEEDVDALIQSLNFAPPDHRA
ncbi:hypothetical protein FGB62_7g652 [Gracilaria domingensis]|nr:hypothetical protein FGB62_7g652 [Gracilaria domingensis]